MEKTFFESVPDYDDDNQEEQLLLEEEEEEEEEVLEYEEMEEADVLRYLDKLEDPWHVVRRLFRPDWASQTGQKLVDLRKLLEQGYLIVDDLFSNDDSSDGNSDGGLVQSVHDWTLELERNGQLQKAHVFSTDDPGRDLTARDDKTLMLSSKDATSKIIIPPQINRSYFEVMQGSIQSDLNSVLALTENNFVEYQLAYYPERGDARYERHRDSYPDDGSDPLHPLRKVTLVTYMNAQYCGTDKWTPECGGCLRIYPRPSPFSSETSSEPSFIDIEPLPGRSVIFLSGLIDHEVLPVKKGYRIALTAWIH